MNIFRNHNQNKTAKDYIERKRNFNIFYDLCYTVPGRLER